MNIPVTDSHAHLLLLESKGLNPREEIENFFLSGGIFLLDVAVDEKNWKERLSLAEYDKRIKLSSGIHPNSVTNIKRQIRLVEDQLKHPLTIAVGETGLDFFRDNTIKNTQIENFIAHIDLSNNTEKPLIIHNREADKDILEILHGHKPCSGGIMHCFSTTKDTARKIIDIGLYASFAGNLTYKNAEDIREAARFIPMDRLMVETDAPFLAPQKVRGKPNRPQYVLHTLEFLAEIKKVDIKDLAAQIQKNIFECFKCSNQ